MLDQLSIRSFFRFETPVRRRERAPRIDGELDDWKPEQMLPPLVQLEKQEPFADVYAAWNDDGLFFAFDVVTGRTPMVDVEEWWKRDGLRLCIDTRDVRDQKRASRFCHYFYALPVGGGRDRKQPIVGAHRISRAKEHPPIADFSALRIAAQIKPKHGYSVEIAVPAGCLHGWDPVEHPRIGLFYKVKDETQGGQTFSTADELGWNTDPSTWAAAVLVR